MRKPLTTAAWCGIFSLIITLVFVSAGFYIWYNNYDDIPKSLDLIFSLSGIINGVLTIYFFYGFILLGKKFNNKLLVSLTWVSIAFAVFGILLNLVSSGMNFASAESHGNFGNLSVEELQNLQALTTLGFVTIIFFIIISIALGVYYIFFGIAIRKMKDKLKLANTTGILNIVAGATLIILVGYLILLIAYIFEIMLMFEAAGKFENKKSKSLKSEKQQI